MKLERRAAAPNSQPNPSASMPGSPAPLRGASVFGTASASVTWMPGKVLGFSTDLAMDNDGCPVSKELQQE